MSTRRVFGAVCIVYLLGLGASLLLPGWIMVGRWVTWMDPWLVRLWPVDSEISNVARDAAMNIGLFVPLGFLARRFLRQRRRPSAATDVRLVVCGFLVAGAAELLQFFVPGRLPSLSDVLMGGIGTAIGVVAERVAARIGRRSRTPVIN